MSMRTCIYIYVESEWSREVEEKSFTRTEGNWKSAMAAAFKGHEITQVTLQRINISHLEKRKLISKTALERDMLVPRREILVFCVHQSDHCPIWTWAFQLPAEDVRTSERNYETKKHINWLGIRMAITSKQQHLQGKFRGGFTLKMLFHLRFKSHWPIHLDKWKRFISR